MNRVSDLRPSPIAGQWYPSNANQLASSVDHFMDEARLPEFSGEVIAIMAPHAGHLYSGPVAGYAFAAVRGLAPDVVIVVSPMHFPYAEPVLTSAHKAYQTPLGAVTIDQEALEELDPLLIEILGFGLRRIAHDMEHSLEIELPFLQRALIKPFLLLPIMLRDQSLRVAKGLGELLARMITTGKAFAGKQSLLVASTDLSHFYPQPVAKELDREMLRMVADFNPEGVIRVEEEEKGFACGRGALAAVLFAAKGLGGDQAVVLNHATSGDVTGDFSRVVGYGAAVVTRQKN